MTQQDDDALDAALARALDAGAEDTAPLSRAVLTRLAKPSAPVRTSLSDVLVQPLPAAGLLFGLLGLAAMLGYLTGPAAPDEITAISELLGLGF
jgi:anti-sigma factor RsiW